MSLLLDTQLLIWMSDGSPRLPAEVGRLVTDPEVTVAFSAISILEIAIKHGLGREDFRAHPVEMRDELRARGFVELAVLGEHAAAVAELPPLHKDPFDRLLLAQAVVENLTLLTTDRQLARYPGPIRRF